jgi:hypothetical protein
VATGCSIAENREGGGASQDDGAVFLCAATREYRLGNRDFELLNGLCRVILSVGFGLPIFHY